ncbi:hypothetical protein B7463_g10253, partial [Scytalidium lignicola]
MTCSYPSRDKSRKTKNNIGIRKRSPFKRGNPDGQDGSFLKRLEELEQRIERVDKGSNDSLVMESMKPSESVDIVFCNDVNDINENIVSMYEDRPHEMEIFGVTTDNHAAASLSSHICALKYILLPSDNFTTISPIHSNRGANFDTDKKDKKQYLRNLPSVQLLRHLFRCYFEQLSYFFPCVDEEEFMSRFSQIEEEQNLQDDHISIYINPSDSSFIMLMCGVLAVATYLDPKSHDEKSSASPGWRFLSMAETILRRRSSFMTDLDLNLVRYHTVKAMYMTHIEKLSGAYNAIADAVQLAFRIGLNNQSLWRYCSDNDKYARQLLWWTIYYMDRRVAQKCWRPYFIRENEVGVDEPRMMDAERYNISDTMERSNDRKVLLSLRYVQAQVNWARLWARIWDTFFAVRANNGGNNTEEIEIMDTRILHIKRQLDQSLCWDTSQLQDYINLGETDGETRSRLVTFTRINLLRLLIRQNPLHASASAAHSAKICIDLASENIDAIVAYMNTRLNPIPFGLNAVECVVESMCHLAPHLTSTKSEDLHCVSSFFRAIEFLERLSSSLGAAQRALTVLDEIIKNGRQTVLESKLSAGQSVPSLLVPSQMTSLEMLDNSLINPDQSGINFHGLNLESLSNVFPPLNWGLASDPVMDGNDGNSINFNYDQTY